MDEVWVWMNVVLVNFYFDDEFNYFMDWFKVFFKSWYFDVFDLNKNLKWNVLFFFVMVLSEFWWVWWVRGFLDLRVFGFIFIGWKVVIEVI